MNDIDSVISRQVGNKTQVRLHKKYKRQMCQRCGAEFPKNLKIEKNKCGYFEHTCKLCHFRKNVQINPNPKPKNKDKKSCFAFKILLAMRLVRGPGRRTRTSVSEKCSLIAMIQNSNVA